MLPCAARAAELLACYLIDQSAQEVGGTVSVTIDYKWLRGTEDQGMHTHIDKLTVERRKMNGLKNLVSHISNVNHWMMSHDNIWPALDPKHPLVAQARQQTRNSRSVSVKDRSRGSHEKRESQDMRDSQDGADPVRCPQTGRSGRVQRLVGALLCGS